MRLGDDVKIKFKAPETWVFKLEGEYKELKIKVICDWSMLNMFLIFEKKKNRLYTFIVHSFEEIEKHLDDNGIESNIEDFYQYIDRQLKIISIQEDIDEIQKSM